MHRVAADPTDPLAGAMIRAPGPAGSGPKGPPGVHDRGRAGLCGKGRPSLPPPQPSLRPTRNRVESWSSDSPSSSHQEKSSRGEIFLFSRTQYKALANSRPLRKLQNVCSPNRMQAHQEVVVTEPSEIAIQASNKAKSRPYAVAVAAFSAVAMV